jgi:GR25 family glycosyltransferase involved in LPS biosynthesis
MRVGITCEIEYSVFSSGSTNTSLALAELMKSLGHEATLINLKSEARPWWDDCKGIERMFSVKHISDVTAAAFDLVFEVGAHTLSTDMRAFITSKSIWIIRKHFVLSEIENMIFHVQGKPRNMNGISEAWIMNDVTSPDDVSILETLVRVPVRQVSFLWTPIPAEAHARAVGSPVWKMNQSGNFVVHMVDTNTTNSSSSILPLVILREAKHRKMPLEKWYLHNGEQLSKTKFFRENVLKHCSYTDLSGECVGRQRSVEWASQDGALAMVHIRFRNLRPVLLDLAWAGVPVIHNSPVFHNVLGPQISLYYSNNSVEEAIDAFKQLTENVGSKTGAILNTARERLLHKWSPVSPSIRREWEHNLKGFIVSRPAVGGNVEPSAPVAPVPPCEKAVYNVVFTDMEHVQQGASCSFQGDYNFFTLLLNEAGKHMTPQRSVVGWNMQTWSGGTPDLVVFGPFGEDWKSFPVTIPKVHYTGENTPPIVSDGVVMNIGYQHKYFIKDDYLRIPLWMMEINWFNADVERLVNPKPIPLDLCTNPRPESLEARNKFCSFIVSNPRNPLRNQSFHWLNQYKAVDSAGALFNTIGNELMAGLGGGGGELKKTKFMMNYKFALAYENSRDTGYCTEKYLHAKASGAIPIYWGDPDFQRDFDPAGCIDARNFTTPEDLICAVKEIDTNDELWRAKAAVPALDEYRVDLTRRALAECAMRLYSFMKVDPVATKTIPRFLGCAKGSPEASAGMEYFLREPVAPAVVAPVATPELPIVVTYATFSFLGSLQHWLASIKAQTRVLPRLNAIVFLGPDVSPDTQANLQESYPFATFEYVPSDWTPPNFPDFWEPTNYGWKIWIYHTLVNRESLKGSMILYMDAGAVLCRWPTAWIAEAAEHGICCLQDPREENDRWCGDLFCSRLNVTDAERSQKQIVAGILCFRAGHDTPVKFFEEAFRYAQDKDLLVGPRISGVGTDGKSYGHRQDQSILSILALRHSLEMYPLDSVYGDHSMRRTFQKGKCIYVHRGNFNQSVDFLPGISDCFVINLDRRKDRLDKLWASHPELEGRVERQPAFDGKSLVLTPELAQLFRPNDFFWKKAVMGCALSHLSLWWKLVNDHPDIQNYLILEDDVKFNPGWEDTLTKSMAHIPEDYDVLYLGGILPPNRAGFEKVLEPVTKYYSRIKPHNMFSQGEPTRYFHSCAYSYILSRQGALKIMEGLQAHQGYWTSADHIMCSPFDKMNLYFLTPSVTGCFQDDDPAYANSDFNNFSRVDKFDSDLWNNDERFDKNAVPAATEPYNTAKLLKAIFSPGRPAPAVPAALPATAPAAALAAPPPSNVISEIYGILKVQFTCVKGISTEFSKQYEASWLCSLMGKLSNISVALVDETTNLTPGKMPIMILQRPYIAEAARVLIAWNQRGIKFKILHLSDEGTDPKMRDNIAVYALPNCVSIARFYMRDDFPPGTEAKIHIIPLGYHWSKLNLEQSPLVRTPQIPFRELHWSFHGTDWQGRSEQMKPLLEMKVNNAVKFYSKWNDPENLSKSEYLAILVNTIFVPCPVGVNAETFRFYEALEAGCIPLVIKSSQNEVWFNWVSKYIPLVAISSWAEATQVMHSLLSRPEALEIYRKKVLNGWVAWTNELKRNATAWIMT